MSTTPVSDTDTPHEPALPQHWGAGWIAREDYPTLKALMPDMPPTFDDWHAGVRTRIAGAKEAGYSVYPAPLRPEVFVAWCAANAMSPGQVSRQAFASDQANWDKDTPF